MRRPIPGLAARVPAEAPEPARLRALLTLRAVPGIGDVRLAGLLHRHGSPERALAALDREHPEWASVASSPRVAARVEHALRSLAALADARVLAAGDADYPGRLLELHDPPAFLSVRGPLDRLDGRLAAIVGTRAHTEYGADVARSLAEGLAAAGVVVVSGLAHGIDRFAHEAALGAGGTTVAVVGCGLDVAYPPAHAALQEEIACRGLVASEFLPGEPALPHHFPRRNRVIAALAEVVIVVEAPARSGALITAHHALDLGREIFAVPGPIGRRTSQGTNALIRDGAGIVTDVADVLAAMGVEPVVRTPAPVPAGAEGPARSVLAALGDEPRHVDDLAASTRLAPGVTLAALLELEVSGLARHVAGMRFGRALGPR